MDTNRKLQLMRQRLKALVIPDEVLPEGEEVLKAAGMKPKMLDTLRREWLNDLVSQTDAAEFRSAAANPGGHFLRWLAARARNPYHVTRKTLDSVGDSFGAEIAFRLATTVWPQEIAWAQRMRLDGNPFTAFKAALFLRGAEGNPSKTFEAIAELYADHVTRAGYADSEAHELSVTEIRFNADVPDFAPLFLRYATRAYNDTMNSVSREQAEKYAARAALEENAERRRVAAREVARRATASPMRRTVSVIRAAHGFGLSANDLYLIETGFVRSVESGAVEIEIGMRTADAAFMLALADSKRRKAMLDMEALPDPATMMDAWDIANLDGMFLHTLPASLKSLGCGDRQFVEWKEAIVEGRRPLPYDPASDLGFHLVGGGA